LVSSLPPLSLAGHDDLDTPLRSGSREQRGRGVGFDYRLAPEDGPVRSRTARRDPMACRHALHSASTRQRIASHGEVPAAGFAAGWPCWHVTRRQPDSHSSDLSHARPPHRRSDEVRQNRTVGECSGRASKISSAGLAYAAIGRAIAEPDPPLLPQPGAEPLPILPRCYMALVPSIFPRGGIDSRCA